MSIDALLNRAWGVWVENIAINEGGMKLPVYKEVFAKERRLNLFDLREYDFNEVFELVNLNDAKTA